MISRILHVSISKGLVFGYKLLTMLALTGCFGSGVSPADSRLDAGSASGVTAVIVKFKDPNFDPTRKGYLSDLGRSVGERISYIRPMSGGIHLFRIHSTLKGTNLREVSNKLVKRTEIDYAEPDRLMHPMR